jgi:hypothetical protein
MMPASSKQSGTCFGFPDVCKTPSPGGPMPVAYPNEGKVMQCRKTASHVKFCNKEAVTKKSEMPRSMGDEPGTIGGLISSVNMNKVIYLTCSFAVWAMGHQVARLTSMTGHNGSNSNMPLGAQVELSQAEVLVA